MPTSVLLAVLAAAGLLALAPALVRRYDATERLEAARAQSTARVLARARRPRTVPGRTPVNPSRVLVPTLRPSLPAERTPARPGAGSTAGSTARGADRSSGRSSDRSSGRSADHGPRSMAGRRTGLPRHDRPARARRPRYAPAIYRRRRVLAALLLLNLVELVGVVVVGPGFWIGCAVTGTALVAFLAHLRNLALADQRRRRAEARRAAWLAARQAEVRREQERRMAERRAAARRMAGQRESLRRAGGWSAPPTVSYRRAAGGRR